MAITLGLLGSFFAPSAHAQTSDGYQVLSLVNATRASVGAPAVSVDGALSAIAQTWAGVMAAAGTIMHNPGLSLQVGGWSLLAENVGQGASIAQVHQTLLNSPAHYANMTNPAFTAAGAGVVVSGGTVFVVQIFLQSDSTPPPVAAPPPPAPVEPEPDPEPAPPTPPAARTPRPSEPAPEAEPAPASPAPMATPPGPAVPAETVVTGPVNAVEPSQWLVVVLDQLVALDQTVG
jgi:hypothetical protein